MTNPYYYLHTNGSLIFKPHGDPIDFDDSDLVKAYWHCNIQDRSSAWKILLEALALGAKESEVTRLANKWKCDYNDSIEMLKRCESTELMKKGMTRYIPLIFNMKVDEYWTKIRKLGDVA